MKKPASVIRFGILVLFGIFIYRAVFTPSAPTSYSPGNGPKVDGLSQTASGTPGYAARPLESDWPPLGDGGSSAIAPNLLANNYYLVLDGSGSMRDVECSEGNPKIEVAAEALKSFARSLGSEVNLGLLVFDNAGVSERLPLGPSNQSAFDQAIDSVVANKATPLGTAVGLAYKKLEQQARRQLGYGEYHLVILTDGIASDGEDPTTAVQQILASSPVVFHTIGFCIDDKHPLNQPGRTYYLSANDPAALGRGLQSVLAEAPDFSVQDFSNPQ